MEVAKMLADLSAALDALDARGQKAKRKSIARDATLALASAATSRKIRLAIEARERKLDGKLRPCRASTSGYGIRAHSAETRAECSEVAEHKISRGELAWAQVLMECQDTTIRDKGASVMSDDSLSRRLDNLAARAARRASARG